MSNIKIYSSTEEVGHVEFTAFSDGAENCEIVLTNPREFYRSPNIMVSISWDNVTRDIVRLALTKDALDYIIANNGMQNTIVRLHCGYMPQARADRRFDVFMSHPLKVFAGFINSLNFSCVIIEDPHSDVTEGLVNNAIIVDKNVIASTYKDQIEKDLGDEYVVCAPDAGATKDVFKVAQLLEKDFIQAMKVRDVSTGDIVKTEVHLPEQVPEKVLIVDDICDGGFTFVKLAEALKEKGVKTVALLVSHGIFSRGKNFLHAGGIDILYCDNQLETYKEKL